MDRKRLFTFEEVQQLHSSHIKVLKELEDQYISTRPGNENARQGKAGLSISELTEKTELAQSTVSEAVEKMVELGMVKKIDLDNMNATLVKISQEYQSRNLEYL